MPSDDQGVDEVRANEASAPRDQVLQRTVPPQLLGPPPLPEPMGQTSAFLTPPLIVYAIDRNRNYADHRPIHPAPPATVPVQ